MSKLQEMLFKRDLYVQSLKSMIRMQADQITELKKDKDFWMNHYTDLKNIYTSSKEPDLPPDETPLTDTEHWKPLRKGIELPSQRRERLQLASRERKRKALEEQKKAMETSND